MKAKTYCIFGAGAAGLYTAWRLLNGKPAGGKKKDRGLVKGDRLRIFDWGKYDYSRRYPGTREPGARVCTWHFREDREASYLELGGMRYSFWDKKKPRGEGHRLVTTTIEKLGLDEFSVPFNESTDPLMSLRSRNMYASEVDSNHPAPYAADHYAADVPPDDGFTSIELAVRPKESLPTTRRQWCRFYNRGKIEIDMPDSSAFKKGDLLKDIGYWNLGFDVLGQEGFRYLADGNGYSSNVVNSNSAQSFQVNDEFTPGTEYKTLTKGFSSLFTGLFDEVVKLARKKGVKLDYQPNVRLHSILARGRTVHFTTATRAQPDRAGGSGTCDAAFLAMPRHALDLVAQATRYKAARGLDVLNHEKVQLYLESVLMEPSYKIGMFFDTPWWTAEAKDPPKYLPKLVSYFLTAEGLAELEKAGFPARYLKAIARADPAILDKTFATKVEFLARVEECLRKRLTVRQEEQILGVAELDTIGPSITDMPIRQVVYFGDNARDQRGKKVYGLLASYDDIYYTTFWKALELGPRASRRVPESRDVQPLEGPRKAPPVMVKVLRQQLASLHFGPQADYKSVPEPLETRYMDWSLPPFNAGYHAYKSHYDIGDVQRKIRKPSQLIRGKNAEIFIVGETYSNDQAWVEGAFCTAESVLNDFYGIEPLISERFYPFICPR